jgi:hypothetical protein
MLVGVASVWAITIILLAKRAYERDDTWHWNVEWDWYGGDKRLVGFEVLDSMSSGCSIGVRALLVLLFMFVVQGL